MIIESPTPKMLAEVKDGIAWITFNAPEKRNAMSLDMWQGLGQIIGEIEKEESVRVLILKGAGDIAFVSGADISEFEDKRSNQKDRDAYEAAFDNALDKLANFSRPVVAMIRGFCIGRRTRNCAKYRYSHCIKKLEIWYSSSEAWTWLWFSSRKNVGVYRGPFQRQRHFVYCAFLGRK